MTGVPDLSHGRRLSPFPTTLAPGSPPGGGKMRDPGNEVAFPRVLSCTVNPMARTITWVPTLSSYPMVCSMFVMYQSNLSFNIPPGHLNFWKIFVQIPPSWARKAVQMPHHRSIPGDQMPPPLGNFSVAFIMLRKLCMSTWFNRQHSYMPKII